MSSTRQYFMHCLVLSLKTSSGTDRYAPARIHGIESSTHTVTARIGPPHKLDIDKTYEWLRDSYKGIPDYPYLSLVSFSRGDSTISVDRVADLDMKERSVSVKVFVNGSFQYTGCQNEQHMIDVLLYTWTLLVRSSVVTPDPVELRFRVDMVNFGFHLGMKIDRTKLDHYINRDHGVVSMYDQCSNNAVNIKVQRLEPDKVSVLVLQYDPGTGKYTREIMDEINLNRDKVVEHTFRVFCGGSVIQSGRYIDQIRDVHVKFRKFIDSVRDEIKYEPNEAFEDEVDRYIEDMFGESKSIL